MLYAFDDVEIDDRLYQLRRGGAAVRVEPRVFDLLLYLVKHRDRVVPKAELLTAVWQGVAVSDSVLSTAMNGVRRAIGAKGRGAGPIETLYGRGYRLRADVAERADPDAAVAPRFDDAFVGREAALAALRGALARLWKGEGAVAVLCGEAGIGKTRTVEELAREAQGRGARVAAARCPESAAAPAFWPWTQLLRALLAGDAANGLPAELAVLLPELRAEPASDPERFRLFDAVTERLAHAARRTPLVVWIDDLQWTDAASLQLVTWAARELRGDPVLFVVTVRSGADGAPALAEALAELARLDSATRIDLAGLGPDEVARYLEASVGAAPPDAVQALCARTAGNPFFLRELVRQGGRPEGRPPRSEPQASEVSEQGGRPEGRPPRSEPQTSEVSQLGASEGRAADRLAAWTESVPPGAREVIRRRAADLAPRTREVLALAAVIGREFSLPLLAEAAALPREALLAALDDAIATRLVVPVPGALARQRFAHGLVRDALYDDLAPGERARGHERVARALEQLAPDRGEPVWAELAHHFAAAALLGCGAEAVRYAVLA
ncbi:MAG: hypothetical protein DCC71_24845, partial [Proteobacteria bacterium]